MVPILSSVARHYRWLLDVRREVDKTMVKPKVHFFARIGSKFPAGRTVTTRDEVLKNLAYVQRDLIRWDRSIAVVHDLAMPFTSQLDGMKTTWTLIEKVVTDDNASDVNSVLLNILDGVADFACAVMRNMAVYDEILAALLLAFAQACDALAPFCIDGQDALAIRAACAAQKIQLRELLSTKSAFKTPWTAAEMDKYVYKVEREVFAGTAWRQGDSSGEPETVAKTA